MSEVFANIVLNMRHYSKVSWMYPTTMKLLQMQHPWAAVAEARITIIIILVLLQHMVWKAEPRAREGYNSLQMTD